MQNGPSYELQNGVNFRHVPSVVKENPLAQFLHL